MIFQCFIRMVFILQQARRHNGIKRVARIPRVTTLRRQVRNYIPGSRATITIVYQTAYRDVTIRWFRKADSLSLPFSELPDMLPVEGKKYYVTVKGFESLAMLIFNKLPGLSISFAITL